MNKEVRWNSPHQEPCRSKYSHSVLNYCEWKEKHRKGKERAFSLESGEANKISVSGGLSCELKDHPNRT